MIAKLNEIETKLTTEIAETTTLAALEEIRVNALGKKSQLTEVLRGLGQATPDERKQVGARANEIKAKLETLIDSQKAKLEEVAIELRLKSERIDITLPSREIHKGSFHPLTTTTELIVKALGRVGFDMTYGPEIETEYLCFDSVNIPADHPARDMQDTFFAGPGVVLRTQTSPVQMRTMLARKAPVRILCPGAVYRCDSDATHSPMFHQIEGLWVDRDVKMSDLKGMLLYFAKSIFGSDAKIRMRPSFFPFVEPGVEIDVSCFRCGGKDHHCPVCKGSGWLEILGAGMVHPRLFEEAGYDPKELTGFAFGMGIERIAMLLHHISDLRHFFSGDQRFLKQF